MRLFDSHCHLDAPELDAQRVAMLARAREAGVERILVPGTHPAQWNELAAFRGRHEGIDVAVGLHPWELDALDAEATHAALADLPGAAARSGAVAIGEFGVDRLHTRAREAIARQVEVFDAHVRVARATGLPIILHVVGAHGLAIERLERMAPLPGGVVHSYSGSAELVPRYVALGLSLSFSGAVTHRASKKAHAAVRVCPAHRLLVETDAPDQAPEGTTKPNEPARLVAIVEAVASLRGEAAVEVADRTYENASRLFARRG